MNADDRSRVLQRLNVPEPVQELWRPTGNAVQQARSWAHIAARLDALPQRQVVRRRTFALWACACVLATLGVGVNAWLHTPARQWADVAPSNSRAAASGEATTIAAPKDLRLAGGAEFVRLEVEDVRLVPSEHARVTFEDGSYISALEAHTLVEALAMTERDVTLRLVRGAIDVRVTKGGTRKWLIEAGELSVEVVGTQFVVARTEESARVTVQEGVVLVRSQRLPDGVRRLVAGETEEVTRSVAESREARMAKPTRDSPTFDALLQKADEARQAGDLQAAALKLQHLLNSFPNDARSGVVAFQLAIVLQQAGAAPPRIVTAFENALAKARGQSLRQDCYWRLVLALESAGQTERAKQRAAQSLRDYPNGRYAAELRRRANDASTSTSTTP